MRHGITFRGKHSNDVGVIVKTVGRPIIAPVRRIDEEVPYRDGNVDCSETGGRLYYDDKVLELDFYLISHDTVELQKNVTKVANWLAGGYGKLIFDDMLNTVWIAKPVDLDDLTIELYKNGHTKIQFRCRPFNDWIHDSKGVPLDSNHSLDSDIPLGLGDENEIIYGAGATGLELDYCGSAPVRPVVIITPTTETNGFSLTINNSTISSTAAFKNPVTIDCANAVLPSGFSGDFFELKPEINKININCLNGNGQIILEYIPKLLYGDGF